jgi:hypothetical protein
MRGRARTRARTTSDSNREHWAWPTTLKEAKPKAGTIAGILRDCRRHGPTAGVKPRSRTDIKRSDRPPLPSSIRRRPITPTKINRGADVRTVNRHVGPDGQRCPLNESRATESHDSFSRGVYPASSTRDREQPCEGRNPRSAAGRKEGRNLTARPGRGGSRDGSGTPRARNGRGE